MYLLLTGCQYCRYDNTDKDRRGMGMSLNVLEVFPTLVTDLSVGRRDCFEGDLCYSPCPS